LICELTAIVATIVKYRFMRSLNIIRRSLKAFRSFKVFKRSLKVF
jgi:hypothetical protein